MILIVHIFMNVNKLCLNQRQNSPKEKEETGSGHITLSQSHTPCQGETGIIKSLAKVEFTAKDTFIRDSK